MQELEVDFRYTGSEPISFNNIGVGAEGVANVAWRGERLSGPGNAIARVKLAQPLTAGSPLIVNATLTANNTQRTVYAHRRAFADSFPIGTWGYRDWETDRKSTRLNSSHSAKSRMPSSA